MAFKSILKSDAKLVFFIFGVAAFFRIININLIEFKYDEATTLGHIVRFYNHGYFPDIGILSSIRVNNFPLFDYIVIILSIFSRNPIWISFFIAFVNSVMVAFFYIIINRFISGKVAIVSSLLLATSPWAIIFSRKIWAQDSLMFFLIPAIFFLCRIIFQKKLNASFPLFLLLTLLAQIHPQGIFYAVSVAILLIILKARINFRLALLGILVGAVALIPYINFELNTHPICQDCRAFIAYKTIPRPREPENFLRPFELLGGSFAQSEIGYDADLFTNSFPATNISFYIFLLEDIILLISIYLVSRANVKYLFATLPILILPAVYFFSRTASYIIYYVALLPFVFLTLGLGLDILIKSKNRLIKIAGLSFVFIFLANNILYFYFFSQFLSIRKGFRGDYGPAFMVTQQGIDLRLKQYSALPIYDDLRNYAFSLIYDPKFHIRLAEFLSERGKPELAKQELDKK